jgi:hypothetical protein
MSQTSMPARRQTRDRAHDVQLLVALLATDWLHGDRHHAEEIESLTIDLLTDLGEEGEVAKQRLLGAFHYGPLLIAIDPAQATPPGWRQTDLTIEQVRAATASRTMAPG